MYAVLLQETKVMYDTFKEKEQYSILMDKLKLQNKEYIQIKNSDSMRKVFLRERIRYAILHLNMGMAKRYLDAKKQSYKIGKLKKSKNKTNSDGALFSDSTSPNYFSKEKLVVYTVMFGNYDTIKEPIVVPDNVDFFLITDHYKLDINSAWNILDTSRFKGHTDKLDAGMKNRWYKTHPHLLFPEYKYSLYVDSSIKIVTDVTEHINKIGEKGIAIHKHPQWDCVYDELEVVKIYKKDNKQNLAKIERLYKDIKFPKHYGLLENTIIARRHNEKNVICVMEDWWKYIESYSKRDQLSLPVALYDNGVNTCEVCLLGDDIKKNYAFRWESHLGHYGRIKNDNA